MEKKDEYDKIIDEKQQEERLIKSVIELIKSDKPLIIVTEKESLIQGTVPEYISLVMILLSKLGLSAEQVVLTGSAIAVEQFKDKFLKRK